MKRDDAVIASAALGLGLPVDPGEHVVTTQAPGGALWEQRITIAKGEKKSLVLEVKPAPPVEARTGVTAPPTGPAPEPPQQAEPPAARQGTSGRRTAAYVIGGVGVAGLALGGVMGGLALGKKSIIQNHCGAAIKAAPLDCDSTGLAAANSVKTIGLVSTIGFAAGLAGVGTAVVLLLTEPKAAKPTTGKRGPWISADVLSAGPTGAILGVHGSF